MKGMLLSLWNKMSDWVSNGWTQTTYIIVMCILGVCGLLLLSTYLKSNFNKGKKIKWGPLVLALVLFGLMALISALKYT